MKRRHLLALWVALAVGAQVLPRVAADLPSESPRQLSYEIDAALDVPSRSVTASGKLTWRNPSPVPVTEVWLHLYLNAFRDKHSAFMAESGGKHRGHVFDEDHAGHIELTSFRRVDGPELRPAGAFVPPAAYPKDRTVLRIPLDEPIAPGDSHTFELAWVSKLPRVFARTGFAKGGGFFMVAQWYPKFGVFEEGGAGTPGWGWNCHAFHGNSEFYADYGRYRVRLTVPERFAGRLGATGQQVGEPVRGEDGRVTTTFEADDVHDHAWVCGEDFVVHPFTFEGGAGTDPDEQARVARILGRAPEDLALPAVQVYLLLQPEHLDQRERHERAIRHALTLMGFWFGPYPYPTLTVVDPDHRGRDAGGMEYPTLITGGTRLVRAERQLSPEGVLVHEFGHQIFYGLVGSNEFEHAWMDEGLTTYATGKVLMHAYPPAEQVRWYAGLPHYGERPLDFPGLAAGSRKGLPTLARWVEEDLKVPWTPFAGLARAIGIEEPPEALSLWPKEREVTPLAFLREVPPLTHVAPLPASTAERERLWDAGRDLVDPIAGRKAWEYLDRASYGVNSYGRTANALRTLEGLVGEETLVAILRTYAERFRFAHPVPQDLFDTATEVAEAAGKGDLGWFFDEVFVHGRGVDFGIHGLDNTELPRPETSKDAGSEKAAAAAPDGAPTPPALQRAEVIVRRHGDARVPVRVVVQFDDGVVRDLEWGRDDVVRALDGGPAPQTATPARGEQARWVKLWFVGPRKVVVAETDPYRLLGLERNRVNDGLRAEPHRAASWNVALRLMGFVEMTTSFYGGL